MRLVLDELRLPGPDLQALYDAAPPDTPFRLLGTSPRAVERLAGSVGLAADRRSGGTGEQAAAWLRARLAAGDLVILLLDLRHLGRALPGGHYVVAYAADDEGVHVTNMVRTSRHPGPHAHVPWRELLPAWRCRAALLPSWSYAAVACRPPPASR